MPNAVSSRRNHTLPLTAGVMLLAVAFVMAAVLLWWDASYDGIGHRVGWIVFFILQVPMVVLIHELGHYGMAHLLGWRVPIFIWGSLVVRLTPLRVMRSSAALGTPLLGAVVAVPPDGHESRAGWIAIYAAGPLATLAFGVASFILSIAAGTHIDAGMAFAIFAILGFADAVLNLIPFRRGNDGAQILGFLRGRDVKRSALYARMAEQEINGVRPRDWPRELIDAMRVESLWLEAPGASVNIYIYHFDRGELVPARQALDRASENRQVLAERAFFAAWVDRDAAAARAQFARAPLHQLQAYTGYWRAAAAVAVAEMDAPAARELIRKARIVAAESAYTTGFDRDILNALERRLMERT